VDFVAFVEKGLGETEYFLLIGSFKPTGKSLNKVEYVHVNILMRGLRD
jgi:hypothetical protein